MWYCLSNIFFIFDIIFLFLLPLKNETPDSETYTLPRDLFSYKYFKNNFQMMVIDLTLDNIIVLLK